MEKTYDLELLAVHSMIEQGLQPVFSPDVFEQLEAIPGPAKAPIKCEDLRSLLWCSIDNDDSRDLDQLTYAEKELDGGWTIWIAVADVDALVPKDSAIDQHAAINTTSVYTPAKIFPMIPEPLSTDLTSLNEHEDRVAIIIKIKISPKGEIGKGTIFQGLVNNHAKLAYKSVGAWLDGKGDIPEKIKKVSGLEEILRCQNEVAQALKQHRHELGSLTLMTPEVEAKVSTDKNVTLEPPVYNSAMDLIENFMVAANTTTANNLRDAKIPSLRRVVKVPKRWERIVELAGEQGETLPIVPDSKALDKFLVKMRDRDPETFPDLSLAVIKLLGKGEYIVENPNDKPTGHFGLALSEYTHSTAPNRRFPDLISQRQYKALINNKESPYSLSDLKTLADHCSNQEDAAKKVERHLVKSAAAVLLSPQIGSVYKGVITGVTDKGIWVRVFNPSVEGKIIYGHQRADVGDKVNVKLVSVDVPRGFIDFVIV